VSNPVIAGEGDRPPLSPGLGLHNGRVFVLVRDHPIAAGVIVRALDLAVPDVTFPVDLKGGASRFQQRTTQLESAVLEIDLEAVGQALTRRLDGPVRSVAMTAEAGTIAIEAELTQGKKRAHERMRAVALAGRGRSLLLRPVEVVRIGAAVVPASQVADAIARLASALPGGKALALQPDGMGGVSLDPLAAALWAVLPPSGWKLPSHDGLPLSRVYGATNGRWIIAYGASPQDLTLPPEHPDGARIALAAQAREDTLRLAEAAGGDVRTRFFALRAALDPQLGPPALLERALWLGGSEPDLRADLADLVADELAVRPRSPVASAVRASVALAEGDARGAREDLDRAAAGFAEAGRPRLAGLALRVAAEHTEGAERTARLEGALAAVGDDPEILRALAEQMVATKDPSALSMARRLARVAARPEIRAWAHVAAGDALRLVDKEPIAAKREYERALILDPDHGGALEGLAQALEQQGDPRRAAAILERLFERALASGDRTRAGAISVSLGDLWRPLDLEAAMARWRRALELDPRQADAAQRLARAAADLPESAQAFEAAERALAIGALDPKTEIELRMRLAGLARKTPRREAEAIAHLEAVLAHVPDHAAALAALRSSPKKDALGPALGRAAEHRLAHGDAAGAGELVLEHAGVASTPDARQAVERRAQQIRAANPGQAAAIEALIRVEARPEAREALIRQHLATPLVPERRAEAFLALAEALAAQKNGSEAVAAAEAALAATALAAGPLSGGTPDVPRWIAFARALAEGGFAREATRVLAHLAKRLPVSQRAPLLRAEAEAHDATGDATAAYDAWLRLDGEHGLEVGDYPRAVQWASAAGHHADTRSWLDRWGAAIEHDPSARGAWWAARADAARAAGDLDGEIESLEALLSLGAKSSVNEHADAIAARLAARLFDAGRGRQLATLERRRATMPGVTPIQAIGRHVAAADAFVRIGDDDAAELDLDRAIALGHGAPAASARLNEALELRETIARRRGDPGRIVAVLDRKAELAINVEARAKIRLEQADVLATAGRHGDLVDRLERAGAELPHDLGIARRLAFEAKRLGRLHVWAQTEAHVAALVEERGDRVAGREQHAIAAEALAEVGRLDEAMVHDKAVVARADDLPLSRFERSLRRLERHARNTGDSALLADVLERWARVESPAVAAERLSEKAELEISLYGPSEIALASLRRARALADDASPRSRDLDGRLTQVLETMGRWEELTAHAVARGARSSGARRAGAYLDAARLLDERLRQPAAALARVRAAIEADPENASARALRRRLLRDTAHGAELAEALLEDASATAHGEEQASLRLEAAEILAPIADADEGSANVPTHPALQRALEVCRDVARGASRLAAPHRRVATYARLLGRFDEEFLALGRLVEVAADPVDRALALWRRVELARGSLEDPLGAQAELHETLQAVLALDPERRKRLQEQLLRTPSIARPDDVDDPIDALLTLGTALTAETRDFETHLRYLNRQIERASDPKARADLFFRIGETTEWKLGDGDAAERAYVAALKEHPAHDRSRRALRGLYLAVDRFGDLAENLGIDELLAIWLELQLTFAGERQIAAAEALWPRLARGTSERARILLTLADLYRTVRDEAEGAVMLLELVIREGPPEDEPAALERLRVLFLEEQHHELYVEILRRQAERSQDDATRARALADLGDAYEWKLGDGIAAEREYRTALAIDSTCAPARERLALLLGSQDRFQELALDLGVAALEKEVRALASKGSREGVRLLKAAEILLAHLGRAEQNELSAQLFERVPDSDLRRRLLLLVAPPAPPPPAPAGSIPSPADAPPDWNDRESAPTGTGMPALSPIEEARGRVRLTVVPFGDPLADVVRLVPRTSDTPAPLPALPGDVVPMSRLHEDASPRGHEDASPRGHEDAPTVLPTSLPPISPWGEGVRAMETEISSRTDPRDGWSLLADRAREGDSRAMGLLRRRAGRTPIHSPSLVALVGALQGKVPEVLGPAALVRALAPEAVADVPPLPALSARVHDRAAWKRLVLGVLDQPLGLLFAHTAIPMAMVLPRSNASDRRPLLPASLLGQAIAQIGDALDLPLAGVIDPAAIGVTIEAGDTPLIVLGTAVPDDARGIYAVARAAMTIRLGGLVEPHLESPTDPRSWTETLLTVADIDGPDDPVADALRVRLGPAGLADVEGLSEKLRPRIEPDAIRAWRADLRRAGEAFAASWVGEVPPERLTDSAANVRGLLAALVSESFATWLARQGRSES